MFCSSLCNFPLSLSIIQSNISSSTSPPSVSCVNQPFLFKLHLSNCHIVSWLTHTLPTRPVLDFPASSNPRRLSQPSLPDHESCLCASCFCPGSWVCPSLCLLGVSRLRHCFPASCTPARPQSSICLLLNGPPSALPTRFRNPCLTSPVRVPSNPQAPCPYFSNHWTKPICCVFYSLFIKIERYYNSFSVVVLLLGPPHNRYPYCDSIFKALLLQSHYFFPLCMYCCILISLGINKVILNLES